jgi:hypothetical protein
MKFPILIFVLACGIVVAEETQEKQKSAALFVEAAKVFQSPRCLNCHPAGDRPTQGTDMHIHTMNVQRGEDGHGAIGMKCTTCHNTDNNRWSGVPGAPKWGLAPREMAWQGLSTAQLCQKLRAKNGKFPGGMTREEFIKHNGEDKLVAWAWNPGAGRTPAPLTQAEFGRIVGQWIDTGMACPN